jgi:predicted regulator of Ras-like GTPase activity (Roadblock/LC7/MglB family)
MSDSTDTSASPTNTLGWMLDDALRMPETRHAILFSDDGLLRAHSTGIAGADAERHAAALSGLRSLARSTAGLCGDPASPWRQSVNEFDGGYVFLVAAGEGAFLALSTTMDVDVAAVSFRMHDLIQRLGAHLTSPTRQDVGSGP